MKKIAFILILFIMFSISTGCEMKSSYGFIHPETEIVKIEIGKIGESKDSDDEAIKKLEQKFASIKEIASEDIIQFIEDFKILSCYTYITDPGSLTVGAIAIKITYSNGDFEIIDDNGQASAKDGMYRSSGLYYFEHTEFDELLNTYLK